MFALSQIYFYLKRKQHAIVGDGAYDIRLAFKNSINEIFDQCLVHTILQ